jgi:hypothetical protein
MIYNTRLVRRNVMYSERVYNCDSCTAGADISGHDPAATSAFAAAVCAFLSFLDIFWPPPLP